MDLLIFLLVLQLQRQLFDHLLADLCRIEPEGDGSVEGEHRDRKLEEGIDSIL